MKTLKAIKYGFIGIIIACAMSQATVTAQDEAPERGLTGVWEVTIAPRNCTTGDPIPAAAFRSVWTFHKDGTMSVTIPPVTTAGTTTLNRTAAYGIWERGLGWSDYVFKFVHIRTNASTLAFAGKQETAGPLALSTSGDEFTTDGSTTVFSVDGVPGTPTCSNSFGTRFKLEQ